MGARYLRQRLRKRAVFDEFIPIEEDQKPFSMENVTATQFKMTHRPWHSTGQIFSEGKPLGTAPEQTRRGAKVSKIAKKVMKMAWEENVLKVIDTATRKLQKLNALVLVDKKMDISTVVSALEDAYKNAGRVVKVWGFDADPKKEENHAELQRVRDGPSASELLFHAGGTGSLPATHMSPQVIVTTMKQCVGVTFWKQCFVLMMQ